MKKKLGCFKKDHPVMWIMKDKCCLTTNHMKFRSLLLKLVTYLTINIINKQEVIWWAGLNLIKCHAIDLLRLLGQGEHGIIYKGLIFESQMEVAVKTSRQSAASIKQLLSEIKILIHVGKHGNVLNLIAANTCELNKGKCRKHFLQV